MIPKTIHYCWFGRKPKPESIVRYMESWKRHLPDYTITEWNEDNFDIDICRYSREAYEAGDYAHVSDVCRVYVLHKYGGIYLDTDVEVLKPFDSFLNFRSFAGVEAYNVCTAVVGAEAGCSWLETFLNYYSRQHFINMFGHAVRTPNTDILTHTILPGIPADTWPAIFPIDFFCGKDYSTGQLYVTANTVSIHHYEASWRKRRTLPVRVRNIIKGLKTRYLL